MEQCRLFGGNGGENGLSRVEKVFVKSLKLSGHWCLLCQIICQTTSRTARRCCLSKQVRRPPPPSLQKIYRYISFWINDDCWFFPRCFVSLIYYVVFLACLVAVQMIVANSVLCRCGPSCTCYVNRPLLAPLVCQPVPAGLHQAA